MKQIGEVLIALSVGLGGSAAAIWAANNGLRLFADIAFHEEFDEYFVLGEDTFGLSHEYDGRSYLLQYQHYDNYILNSYQASIRCHWNHDDQDTSGYVFIDAYQQDDIDNSMDFEIPASRLGIECIPTGDDGYEFALANPEEHDEMFNDMTGYMLQCVRGIIECDSNGLIEIAGLPV